MKKWKKILIAVSAVVVVALAYIIGNFNGFKQGLSAGGVTTSMAYFMTANDHMTDQMANGTCEGLRESINDYLKQMEKLKDIKNNLFVTESSYNGDKMLSHMRLAKIEEHIGNNTERANHIRIAQEACANRKWKDCSEEKLLDIEKRFAKNHPIACLSSDNKDAQQKNRGDRN